MATCGQNITTSTGQGASSAGPTSATDAGGVSPAGRVSVTVTVLPLVEAEPTLVTVIELAPICPWVKLPLCDLAIVRSGCMIVVGSVSELFEVLI